MVLSSNNNGTKVLWLLFISCIVLFLNSVSAAKSDSLKIGFYNSTCPSAEHLIREVVNKAVSKDPGIAAGLVRLHFHDCFVRGCDGSVLLKSTRGNEAERDHRPVNNPSLRGFEVIDEAKAKLERVCPNTVSCADILAFAARDSSYKAGRIHYEVPAGRRDGRISRSTEVVDNLPAATCNAQQLIANFSAKGLSADEMVTLSGAHSFGVSHCAPVSPRLTARDPSLDPAYAAILKEKCLVLPGNNTDVVPLDRVTPHRLDNKYYQELIQHRGLLFSDQTLYTSPDTSELVKIYARYGRLWGPKFAKAMVRMGSIDVLTGKQGEIRKKCSVVNY